MGRIDLSRVVNSPILADDYQILRSVGKFVLGGWQQSSVTIDGYGVVSVASDEDLQMVPEGDRVTGSMVFHSEERIYLTQLDENDNVQHITDKIVWNYQNWRIIAVAPYNNRSFWRAIGVRMSGR